MSRKKIVAATMTAAALGLAFAGYTASRANGTEEMPRPARPLPVSADAGYRQNHQIGHNGAVFEWMDAAASLDRSADPQPGHHDAPVTGKDLVAEVQDELEPVALEHASRVGLGGWAGFGLAGGGGGTQKGTDEWSGGRYASNNFAFGFGGGIGSFGGGGGGGGASNNNNSKGSSGTNDPAGDKPHQDAPAGSNDHPSDKPGSADPKDLTPPSEEQKTHPPGNDEQDHTPGGPNNPGGPTHPGGPNTDHPNPPSGPHSVPEPATLGLLGFGMIAAAALRRRRRS